MVRYRDGDIMPLGQKKIRSGKFWTMWTLSEDEIHEVAKYLGIKRELTLDEIEEIARVYKVYVEHALGSGAYDWEHMLRDAIRETLNIKE